MGYIILYIYLYLYIAWRQYADIPPNHSLSRTAGHYLDKALLSSYHDHDLTSYAFRGAAAAVVSESALRAKSNLFINFSLLLNSIAL